MKGVVFNIFNDMIDEKFSPDTWEDLIDKTNPESGAVYTSAATYPAHELVGYVGALSEITGADPNDLVRAFGGYLMHQFYERHPHFFDDITVREFLLSVHDVIHVEVMKLHTDARLPTFEYEEPSSDSLVMIYSSPRKLCALAEGLLVGVSEIFDTQFHYAQTACVHTGAEKCRFEVSFTNPDKRIG